MYPQPITSSKTTLRSDGACGSGESSSYKHVAPTGQSKQNDFRCNSKWNLSNDKWKMDLI